jgi:DNA repair exonuclease SbcCD ATPase subunit
MTALYNYNRLQKEAHENEVKVYRLFIGLIIVLVVIGFAIIAVLLGYRYYQNKIKKLKTELADATEEYEENLHQLQLLEKTHQAVIGNIQEELDQAQGESSALRDKFAHAQQTISEINQEYEAEKAQLLETNEALNKKIEELQKNTAISKHMELSESFKKEMIVTQILTLADKRKGLVKEKYWDELTKVFGNSFPALYKDLCLYCNTPQNIRVCILTILSVSNDEQAILLDTTKQRVSNVKSDLNRLLFNESTSKTLRKNLIVRYNLYGLERDSKSKRNPM